MNPQRERAREHLPAVLLGVLGIIQALALELLWENGVAGIGRWQALGAGAAGWLQISSIFLGIIVTWLMYATLVLRFAWVPNFLDLILPFILGAFEFLMVTLTAPERVTGFFLVMALMFVISSGGTLLIYGALKRDGVLPEFRFRKQIWGYLPAAGATAGLLLCSVIVASAGPASTVTLVCLGLANGALAMQIGVFWYYWRHDISRAGSPARP